MRFFFTAPRIFGIRPGVSFGGNEVRRLLQPKSAPSAMTGSFVYVIEGVFGHHKVGVSADPNRRIAELQTGSPVPLKFAFVGVTPGTGYDIEGRAHVMLNAYRQAGEWFAVPASAAVGAIMAASYEVGQPVQRVEPHMIAQIIELASRPDSAAVTAANKALPYHLRHPMKWFGMVLAALFVLFFWIIHANAAAPRPAATADRTLACPKESDFERYAVLLTDDVSAAIAFYHAHGCVMLPAGAPVKIDQGSMLQPISHVCVRPVGSPDCLWTFAAHIKE